MVVGKTTAERPRSTYKKATIPSAVRREVARRYGGSPGRTINVPCHYCGTPGYVWWEGLPSWPCFGHELDHVIPERLGGPTTADNLVLACRSCNRRKGTRI